MYTSARPKHESVADFISRESDARGEGQALGWIPWDATHMFYCEEEARGADQAAVELDGWLRCNSQWLLSAIPTYPSSQK